jgi:heavy metal translocating P-type ATPase
MVAHGHNTPDAASSNGEVRLEIEGMHCASCISKVKRAITDVSGVDRAEVSLTDGSARISGSGLDEDEIISAVRKAGYASEVRHDPSVREQRESITESQRSKARSWKHRFLVGLGCTIPLEAIHWLLPLAGVDHVHAITSPWLWVTVAFSTIAQVFVGWGFYASAFKAAKAGGTNMDTLIALGATAAYGLSWGAVIAQALGNALGVPSYFGESAMLLTLISLGHWLETRTTAQTGAAVRELLALQPDTVTRLASDDASEGEEVPSEDVEEGDFLLIRPGERVGVDGEIQRGSSSLDESIVTGESMPVSRAQGDHVIAGSVNTTGRLVIRATSDGRHTTVARIAELVREAQSGETQIQRLADRVSSIFVPAVLGIALVTLVGWMIAGESVTVSIINATTVLIISCPCALGLATPTAVMAGSGGAAKRGIFIRSARALERLPNCKTILFDKTGTLTQGKPRVTDAGDDALRLAAALAASSTHPLSQAVTEAARARELSPPEVSDVEEKPGVGLTGSLDGRRVELISLHEAEGRGVDVNAPQDDTGAASVVLDDGSVVGIVTFNDPVAEDAAETIKRLRAVGVTPVIVTGDRESAAKAIAGKAGIDEVAAKATPDDKIDQVRQRSERGPVAFVGDGINDAGALAEASSRGGVGIAIGTGSNIAVESADVVIPGGSLAAVTEVRRIAGMSLSTIKQNLFFSFFYNVLVIPAAAFGLLGLQGPVFAALAMAFSDVCVVGNSLRLGWRLRKD